MTKSNKISLVIICIFLAIVFVSCLMLKKYVSGSVLLSKADQMEDKFASEIGSLGAYDNTVYYIGNISSFGLSASDSALLENRLTVINPGRVNENTMPVPWDPVEHNYYDDNGKLIKTVPGRIYHKHLLIVIDASVSLSDSEWEIVRQCAVDNSVPVLVFGENNIASFQSKLLISEYHEEELKSYLWIDDSHIKKNPLNFIIGGENLTSSTSATNNSTSSGDDTSKEYSPLSNLSRCSTFVDFICDLFDKQ